jgi:uncharacterized membrane protein
MNRFAVSLVSTAVGAALAYWLDTDNGRRRRALAADRLHRIADETSALASAAAHDARVRSLALTAESRSVFARRAAPWPERMRSQLADLAPHAQTLALRALDTARRTARDRRVIWPLVGLVGLAGIALLARGAVKRHRAETGVRLDRTVHIAAPVARVYAFCRDPQNLARALQHVQAASGDLAGTTFWSVALDDSGETVRWRTRCTGLVDNLLIGWESIPGLEPRHSGAIRFEDCADGTTRVHLRIAYHPRRGPADPRFSRRIGADADRVVDDELMRVKAAVEAEPLPQEAEEGVNSLGDGARVDAMTPSRGIGVSDPSAPFR